MENMNFEEFKVLSDTKKIEFLHKKWGTKKLIAKIEDVRDGKAGKYMYAYPRDLSYANIINPFTNSSQICYVSLKDLNYEELNSSWIIFDFDINFNDKFNERDLIKAEHINLLKSYNEILRDLGFDPENLDDILDICKVKENNIPLEIYTFFWKLNQNLCGEITSNNEKIKELEEKKQGLHQEIEREIFEIRKEESEKIDSEIKTKGDELETIKKQLQRYENLGILIEAVDIDTTPSGRQDISDQDSQIDYIQKYLELKEGLYYSKNIIKRFYSAIKTNNIVILNGLPGTGKTSLVSYFAKAVGGEARIIPVQSSWTDNQDLLGFYNPIEKRYFSTPFIDALVEAKEDPERLYFICLDEMNLAKIEYYFSEFLSVLEKNSSDEKIINLYSKFMYNDLKTKIDELSHLGKTSEILTEQEKDIIGQFNVLRRYPAEFIVPKNVRFVGTINADETTMELSPKVIDRSFIIEIFEDEKKGNENIYEDSEMDEHLYINPEEFTVKDFSDVCEEIVKPINDIRNKLKSMDIILTRRFDKHVREICSVYDWEKESKEELVDYIISSKILPKISVEYEGESDEKYKTVESIEKLIKKTKHPISSEKLKKMKSKSKECGIITYWI